MVMRTDKALAFTNCNFPEVSKYDHSHFIDEENIPELIYSQSQSNSVKELEP